MTVQAISLYTKRKRSALGIVRCNLSPEFRIFYTSFLVPVPCSIRAAR